MRTKVRDINKMKKLLPVLLALIIIASSSKCKEETVTVIETGKGTVEMNFKAKLNSFNKSLVIANQKAAVNFELDINKLFTGVNITQFAGDDASIKVVMDNFKIALVLR